MTPTPRRDLLPGTLDMLILRTLTLQPMHGYGIARHLRQISEEVIQVEEGSLYPALQRLRQKGWVTAAWGTSPNNQRARYYTITTAGRKHLGQAEAGFAELIDAIHRILKPA